MKKISVWEKIKIYKLRSRVLITVIMTVLFGLSLALYFIPELRNDEVISNLLLALFTSLLVTVFTMVTDIIVEYHKLNGEQYLQDIRQFGIDTLNRDKKTVLQKLLNDCDKTIWISGYRLILTREIKKDIAEAIERGAVVEALICPPWSDGFKLVYGENEKVMDNYLACFKTFSEGIKANPKKKDEFIVRFINKPLFSDTYRIDQNLVTGPYMHNEDKEYHHMMAKDSSPIISCVRAICIRSLRKNTRPL